MRLFACTYIIKIKNKGAKGENPQGEKMLIRQSAAVCEQPRQWPHQAGYRRLLETGALEERVAEAKRRLAACDLCGRHCGVNRLKGSRGTVCRTGERATVYSYGAHHGEEDCLRGWNGSGAIFFSRCNLRCAFCQNWDISLLGEGSERSAEEIAEMMLTLQWQGCHNINLVSPSHVVAQILEAVLIAARDGLSVPLVYNSGGFDSLEALELLDGVIDIYMPDLKFGDPDVARVYAKVRDYVAVNRAAVGEMHRQVGDLVLDREGLARRGLLVRHLVLPNDVAGTEAVMGFLASDISPDTYVNLMDQYRPCHRACGHGDIGRRVTSHEFDSAWDSAVRHGLHRLVEGAPWAD